jgi:hypothetical protein
MPALPGLRVVRSPIDGYGVIATRAFAPDEVLAEIDGVAWRDGENVDDKYSLWVDEGLYYDMVDQTRWINHSCDPNAKLDVGVDAASGAVHARVLARRAIAAGEEIAYDYAFPAHLAEPCRCGSARCRGLIIDEDALPLPGTTAPARNGGGAT